MILNGGHETTHYVVRGFQDIPSSVFYYHHEIAFLLSKDDGVGMVSGLVSRVQHRYQGRSCSH